MLLVVVAATGRYAYHSCVFRMIVSVTFAPAEAVTVVVVARVRVGDPYSCVIRITLSVIAVTIIITLAAVSLMVTVLLVAELHIPGESGNKISLHPCGQQWRQ